MEVVTFCTKSMLLFCITLNTTVCTTVYPTLCITIYSTISPKTKKIDKSRTTIYPKPICTTYLITINVINNLPNISPKYLYNNLHPLRVCKSQIIFAFYFGLWVQPVRCRSIFCHMMHGTSRESEIWRWRYHSRHTGSALNASWPAEMLIRIITKHRCYPVCDVSRKWTQMELPFCHW